MRSRGTFLLSAVLSVAAGFAGCSTTFASEKVRGDTQERTAVRTHQGSIAPDFSSLYQRTKDSVVFLRVEKKESDEKGNMVLRNSIGSGVILKSNLISKTLSSEPGVRPTARYENFLITNHHVVENAQNVQVQVFERSKYKAEVVGSWKFRDLAAVRFVTETRMKTADLGNSDELQIGDAIYVIGNPFGRLWSFSAGRVGNVKQDPVFDMIQIDASVNPGNSGGALFNSKGGLVGIPTMTAVSERIGFAISSNIMVRAWPRLLEGGEIPRPMLGAQVISVEEVDAELARKNNLQLNPTLISGALVFGIVPGSPSEKGGLVKGDVILRVQGIEISSARELQDRIGWLRPGDTVRLHIFRNGAVHTADILLVSESQIAHDLDKRKNDPEKGLPVNPNNPKP